MLASVRVHTRELAAGGVTPYYDDGLVTLYHDDALTWKSLPGDVLVTDPPYGRSYRSGKAGRLARSIEGDEDVSARERVLSLWRLFDRPALVFGQWQMPHPEDTKAVLVWDAYPLGMGDLSIPWKPCWHEIYVIGRGFHGHRDSAVLTGFAPVQSLARNGRTHPHEKPVELMHYLIDRCPPGVIFDPFAGSGSTLVAAKRAGRRAIGIEIDEGYCGDAALRLSQDVLGLTA